MQCLSLNGKMNNQHAAVDVFFIHPTTYTGKALEKINGMQDLDDKKLNLDR